MVIRYCISIAVRWRVEYKFLIEEFLIHNVYIYIHYIYKAIEFDPVPGENMALEEFLTEVMGYIFDPKNMGKRVDNLTAEEREALRDLSKWNKDPNNPRLIRIQDKGSCFVVDFKDSYE